MKPYANRIRQAYHILRTIPVENLKLNSWNSGDRISKFSIEPTCNTIACAGGWLALHPEMNKKGLFPSVYGVPSMKGPKNQLWNDEGYAALSRFFNLSYSQAYRLFRSNTKGGHENDKRTILRRFENLMRAHSISF